MPQIRIQLKQWLLTPGKRHFFRALVPVFFEAKLFYLHLLGGWHARSYARSQGLKLNLGCGSNEKAGWINIDAGPNADFMLDLRRRLPFQNDSAALIYSEHFFEHLGYPDSACFHLRECYRVLAPGGLISFGVPHGEKYVRLYLEELAGGKTDIDPPGSYASWARTPMERLNFIFHQAYREDHAEHRFAYDFQTLAKRLSEAGFVQVEERVWDAELDSRYRKFGSLYVHARKP
ncbi:MAG: methyltransferase domain-containing protein [Pseudomonadota bacterium]